MRKHPLAQCREQQLTPRKHSRQRSDAGPHALHSWRLGRWRRASAAEHLDVQTAVVAEKPSRAIARSRARATRSFRPCSAERPPSRPAARSTQWLPLRPQQQHDKRQTLDLKQAGPSLRSDPLAHHRPQTCQEASPARRCAFQKGWQIQQARLQRPSRPPPHPTSSRNKLPPEEIRPTSFVHKHQCCRHRHAPEPDLPRARTVLTACRIRTRSATGTRRKTTTSRTSTPK